MIYTAAGTKPVPDAGSTGANDGTLCGVCPTTRGYFQGAIP